MLAFCLLFYVVGRENLSKKLSFFSGKHKEFRFSPCFVSGLLQVLLQTTNCAQLLRMPSSFARLLIMLQ